MEKIALFVKHKSKPGKRDEVKKVWEQYVKPRVQKSVNHESYYFCFDSADPDVIGAFQVFPSQLAVDKFMSGEWYQEYLEKVSEHILEPPQISTFSPEWIKPH